MLKKNLFILLMCLTALGVTAQTVATEQIVAQPEQPRIDRNILNHMDLGISSGLTGVGVNLAMPVTDYVRVRAGVDYMPRFAVPMTFNIESYTDGGIVSTKFDELQRLMRDLIGYDVDREVHMQGKCNIFDAKLLVDFYPWKSAKGWHITAGFYYGSRTIGHAENRIDEMPTMLAMQIYNKLYDYTSGDDFVNEIVDYFIENPLYNDIYLDPDVAEDAARRIQGKLAGWGRMGVHVGDRPDGTPYMMEPGSDGLVKADMIVNRFKPYLGVGYDAALSADRRLKLGFDVGALFWGGSPKIVTHDGTDLVRDVDDIPGKVGTYVGIATALKVFPTFNITLSYTLF